MTGALAYLTSYETTQGIIALGLGGAIFVLTLFYGFRRQEDTAHKHSMEKARFDEDHRAIRAAEDRKMLELKEGIAANEFKRRVDWKQIEQGPVTIDQRPDHA